MEKFTINIPVTVRCYREEDRIPAEAFSKLIEKELLEPELNSKLTEIVERAKINALASINLMKLTTS